jgi:hypothetical protein
MSSSRSGSKQLKIKTGADGRGKRGDRTGGKRRRQPPVSPTNRSPPRKRFHHPNKEDEAKFAKAIGMDVQFDTENLWLLTQALTSELPGEYKMFVNPDDQAYYVKFDETGTKEKSVEFEHPLIPAYKDIFEKMLRDQQEAQNTLAGATEEATEDAAGGGGDAEEGTAASAGATLTKAQTKKIKNSLEDALLHYKKELGDPESDDLGPDESKAKTYWDVHPDDVEDLAEYMEIDIDTESKLMWIARMASCVELPEGWMEHAADSDIAAMRSELTNEEAGVCYTYEKWLCRNDRETALMAIDDHPSEQYYKEVLRVCREELKEAMEDSMGDDGFGTPDGAVSLVPEYCDEDGSVYTFNHQSREKTKTGRVLDLEAIQAALHGSTAEEEAAARKAAEEEAERRAAEAAAQAEKEKEANASSMTPFERLVEKLTKKGLMERQVVEFAKLIGINPKKERSDFLWLIDQGLSKPMPGWIYRADPDGKWHYYSETSGAGLLDRTASEGGDDSKITGWEAEMERSLNMGAASSQIESVWNHPRAKFYKNLHVKLQKKRRLEGREQLAAKLLQESTEADIRRKHRGRQTGGVGVAHMAPRDGAEDSVTQPTVWSFEQNIKDVPLLGTPTDGSVVESHEKDSRERPLQPGFFKSGHDGTTHDDWAEGSDPNILGGDGPFKDATFEPVDTRPKQKKITRPNNKPGEGRNKSSRGSNSRGFDGNVEPSGFFDSDGKGEGGFTGLAIDAGTNVSPTRVLQNDRGAGNTVYMEPPRMSGMGSMRPQPTHQVRSESTDPNYMGENCARERRKKHKKRKGSKRSKTVMGMANEDAVMGHARKGNTGGIADESDEDFSLLDDEEIQAELGFGKNGGGGDTQWSMSPGATKMSLKPIGLSALPQPKLNFDSHPLDHMATPDISKKRFQPANIGALAEQSPHPLTLLENKLESRGPGKGGGSGAALFSGPVLGKAPLGSLGGGKFGNAVLQPEPEPLKLPSPREKRQRFTPAILSGGLGPGGGAGGIGSGFGPSLLSNGRAGGQ